MLTRILIWLREPNGIIAIATVVIAVVGILQWIILKGQLDETAKEFAASHRPWVTVSGPVQANGPLIIDDTGVHISISYTIKNGGTAPAIGMFTIGPGLVVGQMPSTPQATRQMIDCEIPTVTPAVGMPGTIDKASNVVGLLVLPGDVYEIKGYTLRAPRGQAVFGIRAQSVLFPLCIRYKDDLGSFHGTGVMWRFVASGDQREIVPRGSIEGRFEQLGIGNISY